MRIESIEVVLGEKEYTVQALPYVASRQWRESLLETAKPMILQFAELSDVEIGSADDLVKLLPVAESILLDGLDQIVELLKAYGPVFADDIEYILHNATDKQIFQAFKQVLGLADFLGLMRINLKNPNG